MDNQKTLAPAKKTRPTDPEVEAATKRILSFIEEKGIADVCKRIGISTSSVYQVRSGDSNSFGFSTIIRLSQAYPDFDSHFALTGQRRSSDQFPAEAIYVAGAVADAEQKVRRDVEEQFKALLSEKERQIQTALDDKRHLFELLGKNEGVTNNDPTFASDMALLRIVGGFNSGIPLFK